MHILLVDDDREVLELVTRFLTLATRHDVLPADSAKAALEAISEAPEPFDCILADIQMPDVDGIALVEMARRTPGYLHTPIVMLTAMQDKDHLDRAFIAGASDYIAKPFDFPELQRRLQDVQKLLVEKTRASQAVPTLRDLASMGDEPKAFALDAPVAFPEVASALDYGEFENYLRQLLCNKAARPATLAVKLDRIDRVYAAATTENFRLLLRDAARSVSDVLLAEGGVLSYRGNGIFLCIPQNRPKPRRTCLQKTLNKRFQAIRGQTGEIDPRLFVSDVVAIGGRSVSGALDTLAGAIENVENHALAGTDMFEVHGRLMKQQRLNDEQRRLERRAFETLLRDPNTPPVDDAWSNRLFRRARRGAET